jgi:fucose 4-O-acetylase-like acetyltransferase
VVHPAPAREQAIRPADRAVTVGRATVAKRLYFLDNLRVALIALVIAHHVGQAYGPTGGYWPIQEPTRDPLLGPFFTVNRSFFMSLFFMIAGYSTVMAFESKGPRAFLKSRLLRLGLPTLIFAIAVIPLQYFVLAPAAGASPSTWPVEVGHLWFLEHLLIFSAGYALWRRLRPDRGTVVDVPPPGYRTILSFALVLAVVTGIVRIWFPIDRWVYLFGFLKVAFADVPRDLSFFVIGTLAYRHQWLRTYPARAGYAWLSVGLVAAALWYAYVLGLYRVLPIGETAMDVTYLIWEALLVFGMCIGLTVLFRETLNMHGRLARSLANAEYAAYIFHVPVVLVFQLAILNMALPPLAKFALVTLASVPATFLISHWVRKPLHL